jgi:hypothetical protein
MRLFPTATALALVLQSNLLHAALEADCDAALSPGADVQVDLRYYPQFGDAAPAGLGFLLAANVTEQLGSMAIYGPWFVNASQSVRGVSYNGVYYSATYIADQVPQNAIPGSIIFVGASLLDQRNEEIATADCKIRIK